MFLLSCLIYDYDSKVVVKANSTFNLHAAVWVPEKLQHTSSQLLGGSFTKVQHLCEKIEKQLSLLISFNKTLSDIHLRWQVKALVAHSLGVQDAFDVSCGYALTYFCVAELSPVFPPQLPPAAPLWNRCNRNKANINMINKDRVD